MMMVTRVVSHPLRKCKYSLHGPSLLCVALSLLCAGWLLGYGLAQSNGTSTRFVLRLMNAPPSPRVLPSWRSAPTTKNDDSGHWKREVGVTGFTNQGARDEH